MAKKRADQPDLKLAKGEAEGLASEPDKQAKQRAKRRLVELDRDLAQKIGCIAAHLEITVPDYVNNRLRAQVNEEYLRVQADAGFIPRGP